MNGSSRRLTLTLAVLVGQLLLAGPARAQYTNSKSSSKSTSWKPKSYFDYLDVCRENPMLPQCLNSPIKFQYQFYSSLAKEIELQKSMSRQQAEFAHTAAKSRLASRMQAISTGSQMALRFLNTSDKIKEFQLAFVNLFSGWLDDWKEEAKKTHAQQAALSERTGKKELNRLKAWANFVQQFTIGVASKPADGPFDNTGGFGQYVRRAQPGNRAGWEYQSGRLSPQRHLAPPNL
jgi:hypothetical protein